MAQIGISKQTGLLDKYKDDKSNFSTQQGNQSFAGNSIVGGFTATGEYTEKYAGGNGDFGGGANLSHTNYEVFTHITEQPDPPIYND